MFKIKIFYIILIASIIGGLIGLIIYLTGKKKHKSSPPRRRRTATSNRATSAWRLPRARTARLRWDRRMRRPRPQPAPASLAQQANAAAFPHIWICWPGNDKMPLYLQLCIESIKRHNASKFKIIIVDLVKAVQLLGQLPEYFLYLRYTHRADYLRVHLLAKYGGIYVDADTIGIKPLWPLWKKAKSQGFEMITTAGQTDLLGKSGNMVRFEALGVIKPNCAYIQLLRDRQHKLFTSKLPQLLKNKKAPKTDPLSWSEGLYELMKTRSEDPARRAARRRRLGSAFGAYNSLPLSVRNSKIYYDSMWSWNPTPKQIQSNICPSKIKTVCLVVLNNSYYNKEIKNNNFCNMNSCLSKLLCKKS